MAQLPGPPNPKIHELLIEPRENAAQYWRDVFHYRELFAILAWRDILVRYKQTVVGVTWALIQPLLTMLIFTVVFGRLAKLPSAGVPYHVLVFAGLLPWQLFSQALSGASASLVSQSNLISKVYFPRLIVPAAAVVTSLVDFLIAALLLAVLMVVERVTPTWHLVTFPLFVILALAAALGIGLWFAALTVKYRDFRFIVPFALQLGLFISPVGFSSAIVPSDLKLLYSLNPMVSIIDGFRWSILPHSAPLSLADLGVSCLVIALVLWSGVRYFLHAEASFADVV